MERIKRYELGIISKNTDFDAIKISSIEDSYNYIKKFYGDDINIYESFFILLLNNSNETIAYAKISQGGMTGTIVDPMIIAKYVVDSMAKKVILAHNHPSGNTNPSKSDIELTKQIEKMLSLFGAELIDHIILTENNFYSIETN